MSNVKLQTAKRCYSYLQYHNISLEEFSKMYNDIQKEEETYKQELEKINNPEPKTKPKKSKK